MLVRPRSYVSSGLRYFAATLLIASLAIAGSATSAEAQGNSPRALWVWDAPSAGLDQPVVNFAVQQGIDTLYLNAPPGFSSNPDFGSFIAAADAAGLSVWALAGDPSWSLNSAPVVAWADEVAAFGGFDGLAPDIEPWGLSDWNNAKKQRRIVRSYLSVLSAVSDRNALPVNAAVPFWFDDPSLGSKRLPLIDNVMGRVDAITVMAYRDTAAGPDGIIELASYEVARGAQLGVEVIIGVETDNVAPDKVTFAEEGVAVMEAELAAVETALSGSSAFGGFAVHHYSSYRNLLTGV